MNRKHFAYASIAIFIACSIGILAISIGVHLSSAPAEAQQRQRCTVVGSGYTCNRGCWPTSQGSVAILRFFQLATLGAAP